MPPSGSHKALSPASGKATKVPVAGTEPPIDRVKRRRENAQLPCCVIKSGTLSFDSSNTGYGTYYTVLVLTGLGKRRLAGIWDK